MAIYSNIIILAASILLTGALPLKRDHALYTLTAPGSEPTFAEVTGSAILPFVGLQGHQNLNPRLEPSESSRGAVPVAPVLVAEPPFLLHPIWFDPNSLDPDLAGKNMLRRAAAWLREHPEAASPTGYPFKAAQLEGTVSEHEVYLARPRICDLGYLREAFRTPAGTIDYRCAGEPVTVYVSKGGKVEDTVGRKCLCNALVANIGHPGTRRQIR